MFVGSQKHSIIIIPEEGLEIAGRVGTILLQLKELRGFSAIHRRSYSTHWHYCCTRNYDCCIGSSNGPSFKFRRKE